VAAGLAKAGFRPIVYALAAFIPIRVVEQIKLDIARDNLPVILIGDGAGLVYSTLGCSHQSTEDIACLRAIPNVQIYSPCDAHELRACLELAYTSEAASYVRIGKGDLGLIHKSAVNLEKRPFLLVEHKKHAQIALLATGSMVGKAQLLHQALTLPSSVWSVPCIRPLDKTTLLEICRTNTHLLTLEEHHQNGGLGSAVAEVICEHSPRPLLRLATSDRFIMENGTYQHLLQQHQLDDLSLLQRTRLFLNLN